MVRIALFGLLTLSLWSQLMAAGEPSKLPPYIMGKGRGFEIYASRQWRAEGIGPVKELERKDHGSYGSRDRSFRIWTPTCKPGQKVTFTRKVDLLGRPADARLAIDVPLVVDYYEVFFGNTKVTRNSTTIEKADLRALQRGMNDIDVVVKLKRVSNACNTTILPPEKRGIYFEFTGSFSTDLKVGKPPTPTRYYDSGEVGDGQAMGISVVTLGSATIPDGTFDVRISGPGWCVKRNPDNSCDRYVFSLIKLDHATEGGVRCMNDPSEYRQFVKCVFNDLDPGDKLQVGVGVTFTADPASPAWVQESVQVSWSGRIVDGPAEPRFENNDGSLNLVFCRYGISDAGCKQTR